MAGRVKPPLKCLALGGLLWRYNVYMETLAIILLYFGGNFNSVVNAQYLKAAKGSLLDNIEL